MRFLLLISLLCFTASIEARTWTSTDGRTIEGELIGKTETVAMIERDGGAVVNVPLEKLSPADQAFVAKAKVTSLKEELVKFFQKRRKGESYSPDKFLALPATNQNASVLQSSGWIDDLKSLEKLARDTPADKGLIIEMHRTTDALTKAQADKSMVAEAVRALTSLKAAASK